MKKANQNEFHKSVLLNQSLEVLSIETGKWYIDATVGGGGHSQAILDKGGLVLGLDQDQEAIETAQEKLSQNFSQDKFVLVKTNFANLADICRDKQIQPSGILFDLGVSSYQLTGNGRGFSFRENESLDMRMDPDNQTVTAKDLVNGLYEKELEKLIATYGEDQLARNIAAAIVKAREAGPIESTDQLVGTVEGVYRRAFNKPSLMHPATKTFQALRIAVNDEINVLKQGLEAALQVLSSKGRLAIISFHGLEDKVVKNTFTDWEGKYLGQKLFKKPIGPNDEELTNNPRSRSAKLRAFVTK